jgi:hypothetical protein
VILFSRGTLLFIEDLNFSSKPFISSFIGDCISLRIDIRSLKVKKAIYKNERNENLYKGFVINGKITDFKGS